VAHPQGKASREIADSPRQGQSQAGNTLKEIRRVKSSNPRRKRPAEDGSGGRIPKYPICTPAEAKRLFKKYKGTEELQKHETGEIQKFDVVLFPTRPPW
jgi:hypothetical protein